MFLGDPDLLDRPDVSDSQHASNVSTWVRRWSHLLVPGTSVLDVACGSGRHMKWFSERGHPVTGIDRSMDAIDTAKAYGEAVLADIETAPWPLQEEGCARQFGAVIITNYLWRPLFPLIASSLAPGGALIYETFSQGNEALGKPSRADFLLQPAELLTVFAKLRTVAFEEGLLENPARVVQRFAAVNQVAMDSNRGHQVIGLSS